MGSASGSKLPSKATKREIFLPHLSPSNPNPNGDQLPPNPNPNGDPSAVPAADDALAGAQFLSREEVLRRRSRRLKQLLRCFRRHYWAIMEEIRVKHRDYYWEFGKSPVEEENAENGEVVERRRCACVGCKSKAMPLTSYCHSHILMDAKQTLYKPCNYVIKSTNNGPQICAKPVLKAAVPSLCPAHFQRAQKQVSQALKKAGLNVSSQNKPFPKLSVLISECVRQIQIKRRRKRPAKTKPENDESLT